MTILSWAWTLMALTGAVLVAFGSPFWGQACWSVSNTGLAYHNYKRGDKAQATLFSCYVVIVTCGVVRAWPF